MTIFDYKKDLKTLYFPSKKDFSIVDVPEMNFLMVDGHGDPNTSLDFQAAVNALYSLAYGIKFAIKSRGVEYSVPPLEGLWWVDDMSQFTRISKDEWDWTVMIMQPDAVTAEDFERARHEVGMKKDLPALPKVRLAPYAEGLAVQIMYFGSYAEESLTITRMHAFIHEHGFALNGKHHEIYLGDPRRTAPEKLRTVIRQPIRKI
jgi:hypothetical protein